MALKQSLVRYTQISIVYSNAKEIFKILCLKNPLEDW
jgi:hypothetical protein